MYKHALLLACFAYLVHGRRLKAEAGTANLHLTAASRLKALETLLRVDGLAAAFNTAGRGVHLHANKPNFQRPAPHGGLPRFPVSNLLLRQACLLAFDRRERVADMVMVAGPPSVSTEKEDTDSNTGIDTDMNKEGLLVPESDDTYRRGLITVGLITVLFASNSPAVHEAFVVEPQLPPLLLNAAVAVIGLAGLIFSGDLLKDSTELPATLQVDENDESAPLRAGLELGLWKFLGTTANLYGLSFTSADHGAFLIQLTTLFVPAAQGVMGVPIPRRIWTAIALALAGVVLFTQDPESVGASVQGDALCVLAATLYATYDLRLFYWGKKVEPLSLISNKVAVQATLSIILLAIAAPQQSTEFLANVSPGNAILIGALAVWSGLVVNGIVPFLQVGGQQAIGPARAQVIYASQPLWAALLSLVLLHETVGPEGLAGGSAFIAACFLAATAPVPDADCGEDVCEI